MRFKGEFDERLKRCGIKGSFGYDFYFKNYIFNGVELKNKSIMDFGGGNGIASFFAVHYNEACDCTIVDPFDEGSNAEMVNQYHKLSRFYGGAVRLHNDYVDSLPVRETYDVILMHNSINHIGEDIIEEIGVNKNYWEEYLEKIKPILLRAKRGAVIIVADCSNKNFWNDFGVRNPIAPTIEWRLHQPPHVWREMFEQLGCSHINTNWTTRRELLVPGKMLLANKFCQYFLGSHFVSFYEKT